MLEYNGYSYKKDNNLYVFRHSAVDSIGLSIIIFIALVMVIILVLVDPLFGAGALVVAFLIFGPIVLRSKGKSRVEIDSGKRVLRIFENSHKTVKGFDEIQSIYTHSKFVDEYSSAFKSSSKEYRVTIGLEIDSNHIPLFHLIADHEKPSKEANEVHDFLESIIRNS